MKLILCGCLLLISQLVMYAQNHCANNGSPFSLTFMSNIVTCDSIEGKPIKGKFVFRGDITKELKLSEIEIIRFQLKIATDSIVYTLDEWRRGIPISPSCESLLKSYAEQIAGNAQIEIKPNRRYCPIKVYLVVKINDGGDDQIRTLD